MSIGFFLLAGLLYVGWVVYLAKKGIEVAPRQEMFLCDVHGPIAKKDVLTLSAYTDKPIEYCPFCFNDRMKGKK